MSFQRLGLRMAQQSMLRSPTTTAAIRSRMSLFQRRFASHDSQKLTGPADNAFNRERMAVKQHAAETSGKLQLCAKALTIFGN